MNQKLTDIIDTFQSVEPDMRGELLLDFSRKLPPLPDRLVEQRDAGINRVHECQTPVYLWVEPDNGHLRISADVAKEAPTIMGFISIVLSAFDGAPAAEVAALPTDLLEQLGLQDLLRMQRRVGLAAVLGRIKNSACEQLS